MDNLSKFAERLDEFMFDHDLKASKLSEEIKVTPTTITRYLHGKHAPSIEILIKLADYFNCSCEYLLGRTDEECYSAFCRCPPFAEQLKVLKAKFKCSWRTFYIKTDVTESRFYEWKNGNSIPALDCIIMLADGFKCTVDFILGRTKN